MFGQAMPRLRMGLPSLNIVAMSFSQAKRRFKIKKKLGQGSFGAAYAATLDGKKVIVKTAEGTPGFVSMHSAVESMAHEVRVLRRLQKFPFVPRLTEVGTDYFVQEDVGGVSMLHLLVKGGLEAREVLSVVVSSGIILSQLHKDGVAHDDYEARNILLTPNGVVVIDFGLGVIRDEAGQERFQAALEHDIITTLETIILALSARDVPESIRAMMAGTIEKYRKVLIAHQANENTAAEISKELLFALSQLGARAERDKTQRKPERIKVIAV